MKRIYLLAVLLLSSNVSADEGMTNTDKNANYNKDYYECNVEAEKLIPPADSLFSMATRPSSVDDKTTLCMKARGWVEINESGSQDTITDDY